MTKYIITCAVIISCFGCSKKDSGTDSEPQTLTSDKQSITLNSATGAFDSVNISSNLQWTVSISPSTTDWLSVSPMSGASNANLVIKSLADNLSTTNKTATITISPKSSSASPINISVTQTFKDLKWNAGDFKNFGGSDADQITDIKSTFDGGIIALGFTRSNNGVVNGSHGGRDIWVLKFNSSYTLEWQKTFGGSGFEDANSITVNSDGSYLITGSTSSTDGDLTGTGNRLGFDMWIFKISSSGTMIWQNVFSGKLSEAGVKGIETSDGNLLVAGYSESTDGDFVGGNGQQDAWLFKFSQTGQLIWKKNYGGTDLDSPSDLLELPNGYIFCGRTYSNIGTGILNNGTEDGWVVMVNKSGELQWQQTYGASALDYFSKMAKTSDGVVLAGTTYSPSIPGFKNNFDGWVAKIDFSGQLKWQKALGGTDGDSFNNIVSNSSDGNIYLVGGTMSSDGDCVGNKGLGDIWVASLDKSGNLLKSSLFGGSQDENGYGLLLQSDGSLFASGYSSSSNGDFKSNYGNMDGWLMQIK
jgi:hypothetical protein